MARVALPRQRVEYVAPEAESTKRAHDAAQPPLVILGVVFPRDGSS
jgi:hypothetical protein